MARNHGNHLPSRPPARRWVGLLLAGIIGGVLWARALLASAPHQLQRGVWVGPALLCSDGWWFATAPVEIDFDAGGAVFQCRADTGCRGRATVTRRLPTARLLIEDHGHAMSYRYAVAGQTLVLTAADGTVRAYRWQSASSCGIQ